VRGPATVIDHRAVVDAGAQVAPDVEIGPFSVIGADVEIGPGCVISSHVVIKGPTRIGSGNRIYQFASVGEDSADQKYQGETTRLEIGDHNIIREGVTIHRGTVQDRALTTIGNHNLLMAYVHIGHDSVLGDHVILVNNTAIAGHVVIGDWAILGGYTLVHQRVHIGAHAFSAMGSAIGKDVPAFVTVAGSPARAKGINQEGLRRRGFEARRIAALRSAYRIVYRQGLTVDEALRQLEPLVMESPDVGLFVRSIASATRGIAR
jgi:UDP-N-acetylglucosamine acyltransferase